MEDTVETFFDNKKLYLKSLHDSLTRNSVKNNSMKDYDDLGPTTFDQINRQEF